MSLKVQFPLVITSGEPAGIGLDICLALLANSLTYPIEVLADINELTERARLLGIADKLDACLQNKDSLLQFKHFPVAHRVIPGQLNVNNVPYVLTLLDVAIEGVTQGRYAGIVTGPIHKGIINDFGIPFSGHTEYFAAKAQVKKVVMLLSAKELNVALATTHLALRDVADTISIELLDEVVKIINNDFKQKFKIQQPRILVTGLNPHAGEGGHLGREEIDIIIPAIRKLQSQGIAVSGPYPADTVFQPFILAKGDVVLTMYHDQGLPVLKYAAFDCGVNITLGLPYVRTSVDHGTALDLAGSGKAQSSSLKEAIAVALKMI